MTAIQLIINIAYFLFLSLAGLGLGINILRLVRRLFHHKEKISGSFSAIWLGASLLIGTGTLGYFWMIAGFLGYFTKPVLLGISIVVFVTSARQLYLVAKQIPRWIKDLKVVRHHPFGAIALGLAILISATLFTTAMQPPYATDELHYHFPQARTIVGTHKVPLVFEGGYFYGVIPKLMEVVFAGGISISGYPLAHSLHVVFLYGFVLLLGGVLTKHYNLATAGLGMLFVVLYDDFTWNATVGFVDSATVSLELGALLLVADWFIAKNRFSLSIAGILVGLALSIKYAPMPSVLFMLVVIAVGTYLHGQWRKNIVKNFLPFGALAFIFGGYWYVRNTILYQNPFYPLYLGHKGVDEATYQSLIAAIQEFQSRTFKNFLSIPKKFPSFNEIIVHYSFYLAPLALALRKKWSFHGILGLYFVTYVPYWFFLATHQTRFLMPAILIGLVLTAILLTQVDRRVLILILAIVAVAVFTRNKKENFYGPTSLIYYRDTKLHINDSMYAFGRISETEFLNSRFGCQYEIVKTMQDKKLTGNVIDNWTIWHDPSVTFFASPQNRFRSYGFDLQKDRATLISDLQVEGLRYLYLNVDTKARYLANPDPEVKQSVPLKYATEEFLLPRANLIYETGYCKLYEINFDQLVKDLQ